jgi:NTE family protein
MVGALQALEAETGFAPGAADHIVGTSAGAVVGALVAAGYSPRTMAAYSSGAPLAEIKELEQLAADAADRSIGDEYRLKLLPPPIGPGSLRMAIASLLRAKARTPAVVVSALLPRGVIRTEPIRGLVERFVRSAWPDHPAFWAVACDYSGGERVAFGSPLAPKARIGEAVAASCAIPAFYCPVSINGRRYVDGGICSPSNLDLLADSDLDLVICLNPMSSQASCTPRSTAERFAAAARRRIGRVLGSEARKLRERGTDVLLIQPSAADLAVMGANLMARDRRSLVLETAYASTVRALRRLGADQALPEPAARPLGSPVGATIGLATRAA